MTALAAEAVVAQVRELPSLPAVVIELIDSLGDERSSVQQLAAKISYDQAIAAKTLRLANSSFYGMSREVTSIADATSILGMRTLRRVAIAAGLTGAFDGAACPGLDFDAFWRHSIGTALCSAAVAQAVGVDEGRAFTVGLVHDIGRLALASGFSQAYAEALAYQQTHDCPAVEAERRVLSTDHAAVGGLIAAHWRFSPEMVDAIADHHEPTPGAGKAVSLADLAHVADNVAHALDLSRLDTDAVPPLSVASWSRMAIDDAGWRRVFRQTEAQHQAMCAALLN